MEPWHIGGQKCKGRENTQDEEEPTKQVVEGGVTTERHEGEGFRIPSSKTKNSDFCSQMSNWVGTHSVDHVSFPLSVIMFREMIRVDAF